MTTVESDPAINVSIAKLTNPAKVSGIIIKLRIIIYRQPFQGFFIFEYLHLFSFYSKFIRNLKKFTLYRFKFRIFEAGPRFLMEKFIFCYQSDKIFVDPVGIQKNNWFNFK